MNTALLAKQAWRLSQDTESFWARTLKGIYYPNRNFWKATPQTRGSWVWQSILLGRELLKKAGRWSAGSGESLSITEDNWLANGQQAILNTGANATKVQELLDPFHKWNLDALR